MTFYIEPSVESSIEPSAEGSIEPSTGSIEPSTEGSIYRTFYRRKSSIEKTGIILSNFRTIFYRTSYGFL